MGLYGWGEPLINPAYVKMFDYVRNKYNGIEIHISTNGILLNQEWISRLVSYPKSAVNVSLNAANESTHGLLTKSRSFSQIIKNVEALIKTRSETKQDSPFISLSFVMLKQNIEELASFIELSSRLGVECVLLLDLIILEERHRDFCLEGLRSKVKRSLSKAEEIARTKGVRMLRFSKSSYFRVDAGNECLDPWESFKISMNGDVSICCYSGTDAGNLQKQSVREIWNGEIYQCYRRRVNTNRAPAVCLACPRKNERI